MTLYYIILWQYRGIFRSARHSFSTALASIFSDLRIIMLRAEITVSLAVAAVNLSSSPASAEQGGLPTGDLYERHIAKVEKTLDIPSQILPSIAMVESGVCNPVHGRNIAWL